VHQHEEVIVDVDDPRLRRQPLGDFMGVVGSRQPRTDVQELAHSYRTCEVPDRPPQEGTVCPGLGDDARKHGGYPVASLPVDGIVVLAAEPVVPDPGRMRHRRVDRTRLVSSHILSHWQSSPSTLSGQTIPSERRVSLGAVHAER
jgi:hypothetical protein